MQSWLRCSRRASTGSGATSLTPAGGLLKVQSPLMARSPHFDVSSTAVNGGDLRHARHRARDFYRCRDCDAPSRIRNHGHIEIEVHHVLCPAWMRGGKSVDGQPRHSYVASCHEKRHGHTPREPAE